MITFILFCIILILMVIFAGFAVISLILIILKNILGESLVHAGRKIDRRNQRRQEEYNRKHNIKSYSIKFKDIVRFISDKIKGL